MRSAAALVVLCAACLDEHGKHPDGLAPPLHGRWEAGAETLVFDSVDLTMTWSNRERTESGTWRIPEPNRLELICPTCPIDDGLIPIRIGTKHLLVDNVMEGWNTAEVNAVWSGLTRAGQCTFARMIILGATEATDTTAPCCGSGQSCASAGDSFSGAWTPSDGGFTITANGETRELFLMENAIASRRWERVFIPER